MNLLDATLDNAWFIKHPEKIAGEEYETTSFMFPIMVKGTKQDVYNVTNTGLQAKNKADKERKIKLAKAKAKALKIRKRKNGLQ